MKYFISGSAGICGTDFHEVVDAESKVQSYSAGAQICANWCESFGLDFDPDAEETEDYREYEHFVRELDYSVELYDPQKHDHYL